VDHLVSGEAPISAVGRVLRCAGFAGEAFFMMVDNARAEIEPRLMVEIGPAAALEWGVSRHPGMTDIAAFLPAPLPWNNLAAGQHIAWMLWVGAVWWTCFASLAGGADVEA